VGLINELVAVNPELVTNDTVSAKAQKLVFNSRLMELLNLDNPPQDDSIWDLSNTDIQSLLETSPGVSFNNEVGKDQSSDESGLSSEPKQQFKEKKQKGRTNEKSTIEGSGLNVK
jgi:hypothetical protein